MNRGADFDILYGLHSNIPACCIAFWLTEWRAEVERDSPYTRAVHADLAQYVPCPECFALRRIVGLRVCLLDCGKECRDEYLSREPDAKERMQIECVKYLMKGKYDDPTRW